MLKVNVKKLHEDAVLPTKAHENDAGFDLTAVSKTVDEFENLVYDTGIAMEIPVGYVGLVFPRSSISKKDLILSNSVGVIDSDYRGPIMFKFLGDESGDLYKPGDKIGQLIIIPIPKIQLNLVEELSDTDRGTGGFGSTDIYEKNTTSV